MLKTANTSFLLGSHSWRDQFSDAFTVSGGDDDEGGEGEGEGEAEGEKEEKLPTCGDYVMHFLCLPWKIMCAFVPPTGKKKPFIQQVFAWNLQIDYVWYSIYIQ